MDKNVSSTKICYEDFDADISRLQSVIEFSVCTSEEGDILGHVLTGRPSQNPVGQEILI